MKKSIKKLSFTGLNHKFEINNSMADVHSPETKSYNMSRTRNKDTKPELIVRNYFFSKGFRYRLHDKKLPGKPDIILSEYKTVIFIHGCFWHGHEGCKYFVVPKTRSELFFKQVKGYKKF
jgi:DNA mismatch endonuclease (patch repair protein)